MIPDTGNRDINCLTTVISLHVSNPALVGLLMFWSSVFLIEFLGGLCEEKRVSNTEPVHQTVFCAGLPQGSRESDRPDHSPQHHAGAAAPPPQHPPAQPQLLRH